MRKYGMIWLVLLAFLLSACEEIEEEKPWIQVERPQMLFTDTTLLDSYDKDVLNWKLKTAYLERWADKEIVFVRPVLVDIYDSLGERVAFLRADSGSMDMKFTYVSAFGHVYALTPKGASVRADSLLWNKKDNLVRTESYVRVVSEEGDVLQGKGFESDAKMDDGPLENSVGRYRHIPGCGQAPQGRRQEGIGASGKRFFVVASGCVFVVCSQAYGAGSFVFFVA